MATEIDLTGERFDLVDFCEATFFFDPAWQQRGSDVVFPVWGATLLPQNFARFGVELDFSDLKDKVGIYIAGYAWLEFNQVCSGKLSTTLYDVSQQPVVNFMRHFGKTITLSHEWGEPLENAIEYGFIGELAWPHGGLELSLTTAGCVRLLFETADCIAGNTYCKKPREHCWTSARQPPGNMMSIRIDHE